MNTIEELSGYSKTLKELTNGNHHGEARLLVSRIIGNKELIEVVKATNTIIDFEKSNVICDYTDKFYKRFDKLGRAKFGKEKWDKYIRANL